jgi:hypothetical protein
MQRHVAPRLQFVAPLDFVGGKRGSDPDRVRASGEKRENRDQPQRHWDTEGFRTGLFQDGGLHCAVPGGYVLVLHSYGLLFVQAVSQAPAGGPSCGGRVQTQRPRAQNSSPTHDNIIVTSSQGKSALQDTQARKLGG